MGINKHSTILKERDEKEKKSMSLTLIKLNETASDHNTESSTVLYLSVT